MTIENNNRTVAKNGATHGIVFCTEPFDENFTYVEFKVTINIYSKTKSHLFVGAVDRSKYRFDYLTSTYWRDSPSSYYWDVWSLKLIMTDDQGMQIGNYSGFGCSCEDHETKIGIKYNPTESSLSFYKNGFLIGTAF